mmetsp:Transcript_77089/g.136007  ORF Transcript_77089/g.136007 Transcript_77089/m.136007 type:complete len:233 (+) Transcript_77089:26-724(+)
MAMADANFERGRALGLQGDSEGAIAAFKKALQDEPEHASANLGLGIACMELERTKDAVNAFRASLKTAPHNPATLYNLGVALDQHTQKSKVSEKKLKAMLLEAEYALTAACALDPCADSSCQLGVVLLRLGKPRQAVEAFEKALAADPQHATATENLRTFEAAHMTGPSTEALDAAIAAEPQKVFRPPPRVVEAWSDVPVEQEEHPVSSLSEAANLGQKLDELLATGDDLEF